MCNHRLTTITFSSHNQINVWTEEKKGRNEGEIRKIRRKWTNRKERDGFGGIWDCSLLAIMVYREF